VVVRLRFRLRTVVLTVFAAVGVAAWGLLGGLAHTPLPEILWEPVGAPIQVRAGDAAFRSLPREGWPIRSYDDPHAVVVVEPGGRVVIALDDERAPRTVANFVRLAEQGFYDGLTFHRVLPGLLAHGGSQDGAGRGGPGWEIDLELHPEMLHARGAVSMSHREDPDTAGSQFFVCLDELPRLDGSYAVFGRVVEGLEVVERLPAGSPNAAEMETLALRAHDAGYPATIRSVRVFSGLPR
jgi:peptidyl-prolyl cis-trans isomerase B (cyclophilin B)